MYNPYLVIPLAVWAIAQVLKFALAAGRGKLDFKYLYASGGMPSVHSAVVCSLAVTALLVDGAGSPFFGFAIILAAIVMYDSFGVRRASGEQAAALNMLQDSLTRDHIRLMASPVKLREILGHNPLEVTVGAVLGVFLALLFNISRISGPLSFLAAAPGKLEFRIYLGFFAALVIVGLAAKLWLSRRFRKSASIKALVRQLLVMTQTIGWLGLIISFCQYENIAILSGRGGSMLVAAGFLIWSLWLIQKHWRSLPEALASEREQQRKRKWFQFGKGKKRGKR